MSQVYTDGRSHLLARSLRRYAVLILILALLGAGVAVALATSRTQSYSSSSRILLRPSTGNPYSPQTGPSGQQITIAMTTEAALVDSQPVLKLVNAKLSPDLSSADVSVSVPPNTSTIVTTVNASSPGEAQQGAQALAEGYLSYRSGVTTASRKASVDQLNRQISSVKDSLGKANAKLAAATASGTAADPQVTRQAQVLTEQLISLQDLLNTAESVNTDPGTLVSAASPGQRIGIPTWLIVLAGALVGLVVGVAMALWLGRRDRRVHAKAGSVVAGVPLLALLGGRRRADASAADRPAYQRLRTSVLASSALPSAVAISGVSREDSSSHVALELGRSMTRAGYRVALVLATTEESGPFADDARGARGLAEVLRGDTGLRDVLVEYDGLSVLSAGSGIAQQQELLAGERFGRIVEELKAAFDYVLIVTGPAALPAELATARLANALLLVGRDGVTSRVDIADVAARARLVGLSVSGLVLRSRRSRLPGHERGAEQDSRQAPDPEATTSRARDRVGEPVSRVEEERRESRIG